MGNSKETVDAFHEALAALDVKTLRVEHLEKELDEVRGERDLMKRALNRRQDQAVAQLVKTFTTIYRLAGKSEYDPLFAEHEMIVALFGAMVKKVGVEASWGKSEGNKFTSWDHIW